ncbi:PIR Superfamily Protein [Plasmodium ovale curtisi]|uniref:PIR Superfamily Protein n=2 Tax=Plasmodium ovale curtisi TaxID=864141 RepID=A0A1A8WF84_PLAOA|nr:PIR Superfamily Protein [Plasmodium ovale curtisi]
MTRIPGKKVTGKYIFCTNTNYYSVLLKDVEDKKNEVETEQKCDNLTTNMSFSQNTSAKEICKEFKFLYKLFIKYHSKDIPTEETFTDYDCDFLNYWLNYKLRENVNNGSINVKEFYEEIKSKDKELFTTNKELHDYVNVIDPEILKNMQLLYELYDTKQKITDIMFDQDSTEDKKELCKKYTQKCHDNYIQGIDKCLDGYDDFYTALKVFKKGYKYLTDEVPDKSGYCEISEYFRLPEYDPVLETKQRRIMTFKIMSAPLMLPFVIPLLYKYTPLGTFLRTKINIVKNRWINSDEYESELSQLSTNIEDNISDDGEYNIGYYSATN